jgi:hypothetical protein
MKIGLYHFTVYKGDKEQLDKLIAPDNLIAGVFNIIYGNSTPQIEFEAVMEDGVLGLLIGAISTDDGGIPGILVNMIEQYTPNGIFDHMDLLIHLIEYYDSGISEDLSADKTVIDYEV